MEYLQLHSLANQLVVELTQRGQFETRIIADTVAVPVDPLRRSLYLIERQQCNEAVEILCNLKKEKVPVLDVNMMLGLAFIKLGRNEDARLALSEELRLFPRNSTAAAVLRELLGQEA